MPLQKSISNCVETDINIFIDKICLKYDIEKNELLDEWKRTKFGEKEEELSKDKLSGYKKAELQALCKEKRVKVSGTKDELIALLLGTEAPEKTKKDKEK